MGTQRPEDLYKESGVDIEQGDRLVDWLQDSEKSAANASPLGKVLSGIGGFSGLFQPDFGGIDEPVLVASTDGVGTKLLLAIDHGQLEGVGIDLVAMCVNDLYCSGARPLFFLDYFATGKLSDAQFKAVLSGIKDGLNQCQAALLGGETAELPGLYETGHFDLAGFVVGVADKKRILKPENVRAGDALIALPSSGFHANGFSLIRKLLSDRKFLNTNAFKEKLLIPTKIYSELPELYEHLGHHLHAIANITGGGVSGNLSRIVPNGLAAHIDATKFPTPFWMSDFLDKAELETFDVEHVFNLGIGMIAAVANEAIESSISFLAQKGIEASIIGTITEATEDDDAKVIYQQNKTEST